ncbi:MAG: hypothetical protein KBE65_19170 [Phycisphaerae bacterium]|nr:hypothetical protein [Phycisphaerae bacterium]
MHRTSSGRRSISIVGALACSVVMALSISGCGGLRLAPSEKQKQNAWLHSRTAAAAAATARSEETSQQLQSLTQLSETQSQALAAYCGLPKEQPQAKTTEQILAQSNWQLASDALTESAQRPDVWEVADSAMDMGIGIAALFGGVFGTQAVRFLQEARAKSKALKEIIQGNELFKQQNTDQTAAFKAAQQNQSPETRQLVTAMKG